MSELDIKPGDSARITTVIQVRDAWLGSGHLANHTVIESSTGKIYNTLDWGVEVVERAVKAGDQITGKRALSLPIGSVVLWEPGGGASIKVTDTHWASGVDRSGISSTNDEPLFVPRWHDDTALRVLHVGFSKKND